MRSDGVLLVRDDWVVERWSVCCSLWGVQSQQIILRTSDTQDQFTFPTHLIFYPISFSTPYTHTHTHTHTHERQTDKARQTHIHKPFTHRPIYTDSHSRSHTYTSTDAYTHTDRQANIHRHTHTHTHTMPSPSTEQQS